MDKIYIVGFSGGGYATLGTYMKSKHKIKAFSAWASITDLAAWYEESRIRKNKYAADIFNCTDSENEFNTVLAKERSPLFMELPDQPKSSAKIFLYAGIHDGIDGSVPITHSINFYNRMLSDLQIEDSSKYVSMAETNKLLEYRKPLLDLGRLNGTWRDICLQKETNNFKLVIYEGNHEILTEYAFNELLAN